MVKQAKPVVTLLWQSVDAMSTHRRVIKSPTGWRRYWTQAHYTDGEWHIERRFFRRVSALAYAQSKGTLG